MMKKLLKNLTFVAIASLGIATIQAQTPVVHLKFDNNLNDESGNFTFEVSGSATVPYSSSQKIEGSNAINYSSITETTNASYPLIDNVNENSQHISSTTSLGITGNAARTVSAWVRYDDLNDTTNGSHCIVNLGSPTSASQGRMTFTFAAANNDIQLAIGGGNANYEYVNTLTNSSHLEDGDWHHVAFTFSGTTMADITFYVDGLPVTSDGGNNANAINTTDDVVHIGTRGNQSQEWFDGGGIDDVRIYNVALTDAQMLAVYNENVLSTANFAFGELKAYPTVVEDFLTIETTSNDSLQISVYDITGKQVIRTGGDSVDMRDLNSGIYIVKVSQDNKVANLKILKK